MRLNEKIDIAINYMQHAYTSYGKIWFSPTEIGRVINGGHSSVGSPVCKVMVERGLCKRSSIGHYCLTVEGINTLTRKGKLDSTESQLVEEDKVADNEVVTFTIKCTMLKRWALQFVSMLKRMQYFGSIGSSRKVAIYADGDGDFRPKFEIHTEFPEVDPIEENAWGVLYDAG